MDVRIYHFTVLRAYKKYTPGQRVSLVIGNNASPSVLDKYRKLVADGFLQLTNESAQDKEEG